MNMRNLDLLQTNCNEALSTLKGLADTMAKNPRNAAAQSILESSFIRLLKDIVLMVEVMNMNQSEALTGAIETCQKFNGSNLIDRYDGGTVELNGHTQYVVNALQVFLSSITMSKFLKNKLENTNTKTEISTNSFDSSNMNNNTMDSSDEVSISPQESKPQSSLFWKI